MIYKRGETFADIITAKAVFVVWEGELSKLIGKHYGKPYKIQQQGDMMSNDSYFTVEVGPDMEFEIDDWAADDTDEVIEAKAIAQIAAWQAKECPPEHKGTYSEELWWEREGYMPYDILLWDLNRKGLIPAGDYLIEVMW